MTISKYIHPNGTEIPLEKVCEECDGEGVVKMNSGIERIAAERKRQIEIEGWDAENDSRHNKNQLARAAACYALDERSRRLETRLGLKLFKRLWPYDLLWWKPTPENRIRELEKAGALIAAEIDRLQRIEK